MKKSLIILLILVLLLVVISLYIINLFNGTSFCRFEHGSFGKNGDVIIFWKDDNVDLDIYKKNKHIFAQNKIYYFLEMDKYFYAISKWDDYIVVNLKNNKVILDTDDIKQIPEEHLMVFQNRKLFKI